MNQMGFPFVPFTFPTVMFCREAESSGLAQSASWSWADRGWSAYRKGRDSGQISDSEAGNTGRSLSVMQKLGPMTRDEAWVWLATADLFAKSWWGDGTYFRDFGAPSVVGAIGKTIGNAVNDLVSGISQGTGLTKWLWIGGAVGGGVLLYKMMDRKKRG